MQGYAQRSNQQLQPKYQEPSPFYHAIRNSYHNPQQTHFNPQPYPTEQARHSTGQQEVVNNRSAPQAIQSGNADAYGPALQQYGGRFDGKQTCPQQPFTRHQLQYRPSNMAAHNAEVQAPDNPNGHDRFYGQFKTKSCSYVASNQNYSIKERTITHVSSGQRHAYWTQHSYQGNSRTVSSSQISDNNRPCQQLQSRPNHIYPQHPQQFSGQRSGQQQTVPTPGHTLYYNPAAQNRTMVQRNINNQAQSRTPADHTLPNSTTLTPAGPHRNISLPSNNVPQSRPALMSNVLPAQDKNNQACNVNQNAENQRVPASKVQVNTTPRHFNFNAYIKSKLYYLLHSNEEEQGSKNNHQPSDGRLQNTCPDRSDVRSANSELLPEPNVQSTAEPPHKRMNLGQTQTDYWKKHPSKNTSVSQSSSPDTQQMGIPDQNSTEDGHGGQKQSEIEYVTDPAVCLEAVLALRKVFQQVHKAVAIVPPISQQPSNTKKVNDSPPLKIDAFWSQAIESKNPEKNDKLSEDSLSAVQEDDRMSPKSKNSNNADLCMIETSDMCLDNPTAGCQTSDCDSCDGAFALSNVPVVTYTLENLRDLVKKMEITDSSAQCPEKPVGVCNQIMNLYWKGDIEYIKKQLKELHKEVRYLHVEIEKADTAVVFESIAPENFKKLGHCEIVTDEFCSSYRKEYKSSWLNVNGQPADIAKVLSEPLSDYITFSKEPSDNICVPADNLGVNPLKDPDVTTLNVNEHAKPDFESPGSVFAPSAGNSRTKTDTDNKGHSDAENPGVTSVFRVTTKEETFDQGDMQNDKNLSTKPSADATLEDLRADTTTKEHLSQNVKDNLTIASHLDSKQLHDKPLQVVNAVSDAIDESLTTKPSSNFTDIWQVEDISDDDSSDNMEIPTNSTRTMQVENISEDENSDKMEILTNSADMVQVENISEDENLDNMEIPSNSSVEDITSVENSSDDSLLMDVTVLSSEEALKFFEQLEKKSQSDIKVTSSQSNVDHLELVASSPSLPNHEHKANICSRCGINNIPISETDGDRQLFCPLCWDMAPSLELEIDDESETLKDNCSPSVEMEVLEPVLASTDMHVAEEELNEKSKDDTGENSPEIEGTVEQEIVMIQPDMTNDENISMPKLYRNETDVNGSDAELKQLENNGPPTLEMEVLESVTEANSAEEKLTVKPKGDKVVNSVTPEIQRTVEQELAKIQPEKTSVNNKPSSKYAFLKRKRKPSTARFNSDDFLLFAPDAVLKKSQPRIKNHIHHPKAASAVNPAGQSQNCNSTKHVTQPSLVHSSPSAVIDKPLQNHKEKVREFSYSTQLMSKKLQRSNTAPEVQSDKLPEKKITEKKITTEKKKIKFTLYGSKNERHRAIPGRKFLPPSTLTVINACKDVSKNMNQSFPGGRRFSTPATLSDYSDAISAKQKVHNQWSSMFIPQAKKTSPQKSPPKGEPPKVEPPKKKPLKANELLKSKMEALKNQMIQRKMLLLSQDMSKSVQKH